MREQIRIVGAVAVLLFLSPPLLALGELVGPELPVNTFTDSDQGSPAVAVDAAGNFVVVWESWGQDGWYYGIFGQRFDAAGNPVGTEFQVNSGSSGSERYPVVAAAPSGEFVVTWERINESWGYGSGAYAQWFSGSGDPVGAEFELAFAPYQRNFNLDVAADSKGSFIVAWSVINGDNDDVFAQRFDAAGVPQGSSFQVNADTADSADRPDVAANADGDFVVVWSGPTGEISGRRFSASGVPLAGDFAVNSYPTESQGTPAVATTDSGEFFVVWHSWARDGDSGGIFGRRFDTAGEPFGGDFRINSYTPMGQWDPAIAASGVGGFLVTWDSEMQDGSNPGVFGQQFAASGEPIGNEFRINTFTTHTQWKAAVGGGDGQFIVTWESVIQDGDAYGIYAQRVAEGVFADDFEAGDLCAWSAISGGSGCPN